MLRNSLRSLIPTQNIFYIGYVSFLLHYMASLCGTTIMPHYHIYSKFLNICKGEPLFGFLCHIQVYLSGKLHPHGDATSEPYKPTFLATSLMAVLQPSGYSIFHSRDTLIQLSLP